MKTPPRLQSLVEEGLIDTVVRQLMSGKEAMVYVVRRGDETLCAKIYKEATNRSFRQAVDYTENRKTKNTRQARAMAKGTRFGRQAQEAAWQSAEVDALYRLAAAGVRVPQPYNFLDGVLLMELVADAEGDAAPRLNDVCFTAQEARDLLLWLRACAEPDQDRPLRAPCRGARRSAPRWPARPRVHRPRAPDPRHRAHCRADRSTRASRHRPSAPAARSARAAHRVRHRNFRVQQRTAGGYEQRSCADS